MSFTRLLAIAAFAVISFAGGFAVALHGSPHAAQADNCTLPTCNTGGGGGGGGGGGTTTPPPPVSTHQPLPPPGPVTHVKLNNSLGHFIKLAWTLPSSPNLNKVYVLRTLASSGCSSGIHVGTLVGGTTAVRTSAVDRGAVPGVKYCYTVFVTNTAGKRSTAYEYYGTLPDHYPPNPVTAVHAAVSGSHIVVTWPAAPTANHYIVVRGAAGGVCPATPTAANATRFPNDRTTTLTDTTAKPGETYCYSVFPVDAKGNVQKTAAHSDPTGVSATPTGSGSTTTPVSQPTPAAAGSKSSSRLISSAAAQIVAAVGVAVVVFGLIVLAGLKLHGSFNMPARPIVRQSRGYTYGRPRNGMAVRLHLSDYDTRALVIPAVLGVGVLLVIAAVAALVV